MSIVYENWNFCYEIVEAKESAVMKCLKDMATHGWHAISIIYKSDKEAVIYFRCKGRNYKEEYS